jgi:hypothetical protein
LRPRSTPLINACLGRYIFGGYNDQTETTFDEVYVLSLPGFHWFRAPYDPAVPRALPACVVAGKRQMISVGGSNVGLRDPDPWRNGIGVFDLTQLT